MRRVGVGYRHELHEWILSRPAGLDCVEITAEHFFDRQHETLATLSKHFVTFVHGLGLSLGTPGPLDHRYLEQFSDVADSANAEWVSEHVAFTKTADVDLGHLNPLPLTTEALAILTDHAIQVAEACRRPLVLENITFELAMGGGLSEPDFLNMLCERASCKLLLDITNLYINSQNHGFDPVQWLREIEPEFIRQIHIVGYSKVNDRYRDYHGNKIQTELLDLLRIVLNESDADSIILERDERLGELQEIDMEVRALQAIANG